jgi:hypothetical protein
MIPYLCRPPQKKGSLQIKSTNNKFFTNRLIFTLNDSEFFEKNAKKNLVEIKRPLPLHSVQKTGG